MLVDFGPIDNPTGDEDPDFARFWAAYPRHEAKFDARKAWRQLRPDAFTQALILQALAWQAKSVAWTEHGGKFVPRADRWLRGGRWLDERPKAPAKPKLAAYHEWVPYDRRSE